MVVEVGDVKVPKVSEFLLSMAFPIEVLLTPISVTSHRPKRLCIVSELALAIEKSPITTTGMPVPNLRSYGRVYNMAEID